MKCKVCGKNAGKIFKGEILNKYEIDYFFCPNCEHLQTQEPFWLNEAYNEAIAKEDVGILKRNIDNTITTFSIISSFFDKSAKFLDYAGGYGVFARLMRDIGLDYYWDDKYSKNLFMRGFEYKKGDEIELITAFEAFEHFYDPVVELEKMFEISNNVLFTQTLLPIPLKKPSKWWYYSPETGQHISFYTNKTLEIMAQKFNKNYYFSGVFHLFSDKKISNDEFSFAVKNDALIYSKNISELKSKISEDLEYIKNKKRENC